MPRQQSLDALDQAALRRLIGERRPQRHALDERVVWLHHRQQRQQRLHLRGKGKVAVGQFREEQRLLAEAIARQEKALLDAVPDRERPHAVEAQHAGFAPLLIGREDDFCVRFSAEDMPQRLQFAADLDEVVDLAVESDPVATFAEAHRLLAVLGQVEDRQSPVSERHPFLAPDPPTVGATVDHGVQTLLGLASIELADVTKNAAHVFAFDNAGLESHQGQPLRLVSREDPTRADGHRATRNTGARAVRHGGG